MVVTAEGLLGSPCQPTPVAVIQGKVIMGEGGKRGTNRCKSR